MAAKVGAKRPITLPKNSKDALQAVKQSLGLVALDSFFVKHCSNAFGLKLEAATWKASISSTGFWHKSFPTTKYF